MKYEGWPRAIHVAGYIPIHAWVIIRLFIEDAPTRPVVLTAIGLMLAWALIFVIVFTIVDWIKK